MAIVTTYNCNLCASVKGHIHGRDLIFPHGGYRLKFSGCGGIGLVYLDDDSASESIICRSCAKGLHLQVPPKHPNED